MKSFLKVAPYSTVSAEDRVSAIEFINRVNWFFDAWDVESIVQAFAENSVTYHFHGTNRGRAEVRQFLTEKYPYLIPGVSRHATNHIVDADEDGVVVRYHNLLIRYATPEAAPTMGFAKALESQEDMPGIWLYSVMVDRLRRTPEGWEIFERHVGATTTNARLNPSTTDPTYFTHLLPSQQTGE